MENKYIYEALDVKDKKGSFAACEGLWQPATEDSVKAIVERVKACCETDEAVREKNPGYVGIGRSAKDYEWENVKKRLDAGKVVDGLVLYIRKAMPDAPKCPECGCSILDGGYHVPTTGENICSDCGAPGVQTH